MSLDLQKMSRCRKILVGIFGLMMLTAAFLLYTIRQSLPEVKGQVEAKGISQRVEITRSNEGIPTIKGQLNSDVFFAQGYVHAQDRMFQMVLMKHMFLGRMSEVFGEKMINLDRYMRLFGLQEAAFNSYSYFSNESKNILEAYTAGVNQYIDENRSSLEAQLVGHKVEYWRPQDCVVMQKAIAFDLSRHWPRIMKNTVLSATHGNDALDTYFPNDEISEPSVTDEDLKNNNLPYRSKVKVYPDGPQVPMDVVKSLEGFAKLNDGVLKGISTDDTMAPGSNAWAVGPERTASGKPIMASDPHLTYNVPNTFYMINLKSKMFDISGGSIPGSPGMIIGRNAHVSWGFTNSRLDQCDIHYGKNISGKKKRTEIIRVANGDDVKMTFVDTDYGTLISEEGAPYEVALNWTGMAKVDRTLDAIFKINTGQSVKEIKPYLRLFHTPAQNIVLADDQGDYGFYALGQVPIRQHSGRIAVPATPEFAWQGMIPTWEMPYVENPKRGYIMNCNNIVTSQHYGYNLSRLGFDNLRAVRLSSMLKEDHQYSFQEMRDIQMDNEDQEWLVMKEAFLKTKPKSPLSQKALNALKNWNGQATRNSYEVTIYSTWQRNVSAKIYQPIAKTLPRWAKPVHNDFYVRNELLSNGPACQIDGGDCNDFLSETLEESVQQLKSIYSSDDVEKWIWSGVHYGDFKHGIFKKVPVLNSYSSRKITVDGTRDSLNRSRWFSKNDGFAGVEGACIRMISDLDDPYAEFAMPMGQSSNIFSKHYSDMLEGWANGEYIEMPVMDQTGQGARLYLDPAD